APVASEARGQNGAPVMEKRKRARYHAAKARQTRAKSEKIRARCLRRSMEIASARETIAARSELWVLRSKASPFRAGFLPDATEGGGVVVKRGRRRAWKFLLLGLWALAVEAQAAGPDARLTLGSSGLVRAAEAFHRGRH